MQAFMLLKITCAYATRITYTHMDVCNLYWNVTEIFSNIESLYNFCFIAILLKCM